MKKRLFFLLLLTRGLFYIHSQTIDSSKIYLQKSYNFQERGLTDSAIYFSKKALNYFKKDRNDSTKIKAILQVITLSNDIDEIATLSKKIKLLSVKNNNSSLLEKLYYAKAHNYLTSKNYDLALEYYLKVDSLSKSQNNISEITVKSIYDRAKISKATFTHDGIELAYTLSLEALEKAKGIKNVALINRVKLLTSEILFLIDKPNDAVKILKQCEVYFRKVKDYNHMSRVFLLYASHYKYDLKDYDKAESVFINGVNYLKNTQHNRELADLYIFYGDLLKDIKKNYKKALKQYLSSDSVFYKQNPQLNLHYVYLQEDLSDSYEKLKQYKKGFYYNKLAYSSRKKLYKKQNRALSRRLEVKYQAKHKQQQLEAIRLKNTILNQQKTNQRNLYLAGLALTTLTGLFFFFQYRNRQKTTKKLKELDRAKTDFITNISHEFRTPLTLISGPVQSLLKNKSLEKSETKHLQSIKNNSDRLLNLVDQLLDVSKINSGILKIKVKKENICTFTSTVLDNFTFLANKKNIQFIVNKTNCKDETWFNADFLQKIISNLATNAVKYTNENGTISCTYQIKNKQFLFEIKNSGKGLSQKEQKQIFNRFFQVNTNNTGVGVGLALVKDLVHLHKGTISVESEPNKETVFSFQIPISKENYTSNEIILSTKKNSFNKLEEDTSTKKPILLLVEDDIEMQHFIASVLKESYTILTANNGKNGIDLAIKNIPDIIISDVMMPIKNGIELTKTLKTDERTSHIPIILLTAKVGKENKIEGIKIGADAYVTKPFNIEILQVKVNNLINLKQNIRDFYHKYDTLNVENTKIKGIEEHFLQSIESVLKQQLTQTDFNAENFAKAIGVSRMQLHRRIKKITGLTTSEFIRMQRLKLAAFLLQQSDADIVQIAYTVGFNSPSYFNKCFKEMYQCTPKEYIQLNKK